MPKSKHRAGHDKKLAKYKAKRKQEIELLKKKMIEEQIKMQKEKLKSIEDHTSTQEISGPEIDVNELNALDVENVENSTDIKLDDTVILDNIEIIEDDNNNKQ